MYPISVSIAAGGAYAGCAFWGVRPTLALLGIAVVVLCGITFAGLSVSHDAPKAAARLVSAWTVATIIATGVIAGGIAWLTIDLGVFGGDEASDRSKILLALGLAAIGAVSEGLSDGLKSHASGWLARKSWGPKYAKLFPSLPAAPDVAVAAYRSVAGASTLDAWTYTQRRDLLEQVQRAITDDAFFGGRNWVDANPPRRP